MENKSERIENAMEKASQAFWAVIAKSFPEITTGDFPVDAANQFEHACRQAVTIWIDSNTEDTTPDMDAYIELWGLRQAMIDYPEYFNSKKD